MIFRRIDSMALVALVLLFVMGARVLMDITDASGVKSVEASTSFEEEDETNFPAEENLKDDPKKEPNPTQKPEPEPDTIVYPYDSFVLTQGPHGFSYGHMAIDIAAGKGARINSPIKGKVTALYVDQYGNPTIVLENDFYRVTMLHGVYTVEEGDKVKIGKKIGTESNLGYTTDMQGRSCRNRNCGYHTHLNIFDKRKGKNVNPLDVLKR